MVMMHELAHCVQMNHSGAFWKVRNGFAEELRGLWGRGYTGDGFWGRGKTVLSEEYEGNGVGESEVVPRSLCGGTFRSGRGRKRKRGTGKDELTYAEKQQRRIERKFGRNGVALGDDAETKVKLEKGKKPKGKPRVAGSARGRELRAAAALARFGVAKEEEAQKEEKVKNDGEGLESDGETESEFDDVAGETDAVDLDGSKLLDGQGKGMIKVCEDEDQDDIHVKQEMQELQDIHDIEFAARDPQSRVAEAGMSTAGAHVEKEPLDIHDIESASKSPGRRHAEENTTCTANPLVKEEEEQEPSLPLSHETITPFSHPTNPSSFSTEPSTCPLCTSPTPTNPPTCPLCAHVLDPSRVPGTWRCQSRSCNDSAYVNVSDCVLCGVCGTRRV